MLNRSLASTLLPTLVLFVACSEHSETSQAHAAEPQSETSHGFEATMSAAQEQLAATQEKYSEAIQSKLQEYEPEITKLEQDASKLSGEAKTKMDEAIAAIEVKRQHAVSKLSEWKSVSAGTWQSFTREVDQTVMELKKTIDEARAKAK